MEKLSIVLIIGYFLIFTSCSQTEDLDVQTQIPDVYVDNGILVIKNQSVLNNLILSNSKKSKEELTAWQDSLGFECYQIYYDEIFSEYEEVVNNAKSEAPILEFINTYKNEVFIPGGTIDGLPDYSIEPKVVPPYLTVANKDGIFKLGNETIVSTKEKLTTLKSVSTFSCSKKHDKRKMNIQLTVNDPKSNYNYVRVTHSKKVLFAWVSYSTKYYWRYSPNDPGYFATDNDILSGTMFNLLRGSNYLEMWNRGVGEDHKCIFSW
ncbi:hypothetical protein ACT29H_08760 [Thermophagus sp. OGC60D27]|uniref:hypothetical protein n=1 Tax=Thermophagus sp. OGC60D27 TaxID=3458415 RepID=UPI0040384B81